ncbi:hypothetical protein K227x_12850 [Rubripirellula lacrimiformis]|uniref:Uncharacterized protein n=1 Tax=Rubripirellula lacrimiformis TaxID=1930273 RepID=A0A517N6Y3_9BACT|nr:hypothetical protein [Rubripirellula lacrimiformis]QDT02906.1 hypothetical protein K227x_12850 [Rubripirellula lacrimiformis]
MTDTEPPNTPPQAPEHSDGVQNAAVIASALRTSLIVMMLMGLPLIGVLIYLNLNRQTPRPTEVEVTLPAQGEATEQVPPEGATTSAIHFDHPTG